MLVKVILFLSVGFYRSASSIIRTHYYVNLKMTWTAAQQYCRFRYDDLSTISSQAENNNLLSMKTDCSNGCHYGTWIGLHRNSTALSDWKWSGGEGVQFSMWAQNEPNESEMSRCAYYHSGKGKWYADSCSLSLTFFCMEVSSQLVLVQMNKTWIKALDYCRSNYVDIASLRSNEENALAATMSLAAETPDVWIGLHFVVRSWIWMNGDALVYQAWSEGSAPKCPARNNSCGALEAEGKVWKSRDCKEKHNFLCLTK